LPPEVEIAAFRIVQESLTNVARHARVRHARVRLERSGDTLEVQIADDGTGFHAARAAGRGNGLKGMRERMELLGGELEIHSAPGRGTTIAARIVVPEETVK
jgi:signal transduction histidine kinase